ncbi:MAG: hypothetical protein Q9209_003073 [Squamulea sp. 1 TL-2023]
MHKGLDPNTDGKTLQLMGDSLSSPNLYTYHVWNKIDVAYTAGELTITSDKLVAISGLAKKIHTLLQDEYLAGLWKGTLPSDLLWKVVGGNHLSTRATQYRAPTWSWAALDGQIMPGRPNTERNFIIIDEAMTHPLVLENPLGQRLRLSLMRFLPDRPYRKGYNTTLDDDLKASLDFKNSTKRDILEKALKTAEEKKQISLKRRWKIKIKNKEVVVRDVLEKIINWLDHFKAIGDVAVQYDQAHAALPWAGVRFLLKVVVSDTHVFGSTISGLETVSHLITRYAVFEQVYTQRKTVASPGLEPLLTGLYAEALTFLAKAKKYFQTPTAGEGYKTLKDTRYREILDWLSPIRYIEHQKRHSERRLQGSGEWFLNSHEYLNWQSSSTSSMFLLHGMAGSGKTSLASAIVDSILRQSSSNRSPAFLAYIYCSKSATEVELSDPEEIMRSVVRQLGVSCGTQKTVHRAVLNEYERRETEAQLAGFDVARLSLQDCIRLITSITGADPASIVIDAVDEVQPKGRYELVEALQQVIRDSSNAVKIFATSRDDDQVLSLLTNASTLRIRAENQQADMESFVYDQVNHAIKSRRLLGGDVSSNLQADLSQALMDGAGEIFLLVIWQIERLCDMRHEIDVRQAMRRFSQDTLHRLYSGILDSIYKAEAFSRSVALHTFALLLCLREPLSPASFLAALTFTDGEHGTVLQMPQVLTICFNLIIVDSKLNVLRFAHTSVQEFLQGQTDLTQERTEGIVAISCLNSCLYNSPAGTQAGLSPTKQFYHYSVLYWAEHCRATFVAGNDTGLLQLVEDFMLDKGGISLSFIGWLEDVQDYAKTLPRHHLLKKQLSAISSRDQALIFTLCVFGLADPLIQVLKATTPDCNTKNDSGQTALYLASSNGHIIVIRILLDHGADLNTSGGRLGTPLQAACFQGHSDVVQLLVENGADMKLRDLFQNALQASVMGNHENIAMLLLYNGFEINEQSEYDQALEEASQTGFIKVVDHLQKNYSNSFDSISSSECKGIQAAISKGQIGVLERFIQRTSNPQMALPLCSVATAASGGYDGMVMLLLDKGLDIERAGQYGSPLRSASLLSQESTVQLLLNRGAKISASSSIGNALEAAATNGHVYIVKSLLREGVDPNIKGGIYGTALQAAAYRGHLKIAELLLDANADVYLSRISKDAIHAAAESGHEKIIRFLLVHGYRFRHPMPPPQCYIHEEPPPRFRDLLRASSSDHWEPKNSFVDSYVWKMTPPFSAEEVRASLYMASSNGHEDIVACLFSRKLELAPDLERALELAARNGHLGVTDLITAYYQRLLPVGNLTKEDMATYCARVERHVLMPGCLGGHVPIITRALDVIGQHCSTAEMKRIHRVVLHESSIRNRNKILSLVCSFVQFDYEDICKAIIFSCENGSDDTLKLLLASFPHDGPRTTSYGSGNSANPILLQSGFSQAERNPLEQLDYGLYIAAYNGHTHVVKTLIQEGASVNAAFPAILKYVEDWDWVKFLLEREANVNATGYYYGTALQCAARSGNVKFVQHLLSAGAETNILGGEHGTALRAAVVGGHEKVIDILLQHDTDVNLRTLEQGHHPPGNEPIIWLALKSPNLAILRSLTAAGADLQLGLSDQLPTLIFVCSLDELEIVRLFLDKKFDVNPPKRRSRKGYRYPDETSDHHDYCYSDERASALHLACSKGNEDIARRLEVEVIDAEGYSSKTPLQMAAHSGHLHIVQLLINAGVPIDHHNSHGTALSIVSRQNRLGVVEELLLAGATIFDPLGRWNALAEACRPQGHAVVDLLMENLPEILEERASADALPEAASSGDDDVFQVLLTQNAPVSSSTLSHACAASLLGSVSMLLH